MRYPLGVAVFAGMLGVTGFGLFLTPVFYVAIRKLTEGGAVPAATPGAATPAGDPSHSAAATPSR
jgi:hypothetical protein